MSATSVECAPMHAPGRGCALALVAVFGTLAGCVELPVPTRTPYAAAPRSSSTPWSPPPAVTAQRPRTLAARETRIDPQAVYGLADLIDFAHRTNPETQRAWEEARAAAAQAARAEAAYYPTLSAMASGGTSREVHPSTGGTFTTEGPGVNPQLQLNWILLDFGRRGASVERGGQQSLSANFAFNRKLQEVAFVVSRSYFGLDASRARVAAARVSLSGSVGQNVQRYRVGPPFGTFTTNETEYGAFLNFEWKLFDGFERENALREATSQRGAAEADLAALELRAIREVWKAYADVKTALRKRDYALALLTASEEAYASTLESYRTAGLATVLDLVAAQRDLARARTTEIQSRAELLATSAALTFAAGG